MKIEHGNTILRTITIDDIELIRNWRNAETTNLFLVDKKPISVDAQQAWFRSLNPQVSIYFIIEEDAKPAGIIYASNINIDEMSFEGNILTGEEEFKNTSLPVKASLMLSVFFFEKLGFKLSYSKVHKLNNKALDFDRSFGYIEMDRKDQFIISRCHKEKFHSMAGKLKKILYRDAQTKYIFEDGDERFTFMSAASIAD